MRLNVAGATYQRPPSAPAIALLLLCTLSNLFPGAEAARSLRTEFSACATATTGTRGRPDTNNSLAVMCFSRNVVLLDGWECGNSGLISALVYLLLRIHLHRSTGADNVGNVLQRASASIHSPPTAHLHAIHFHETRGRPLHTLPAAAARFSRSRGRSERAIKEQARAKTTLFPNTYTFLLAFSSSAQTRN